MPNHGVELIDGIPVTLKGSEMFAFQPGTPISTRKIKLGNYDSVTKTATWQETDEMKAWLNEHQSNLAPRSRK